MLLWQVPYPTGSFTTNALSSDSGTSRHRGEMALFRMYNKAMNAAEISAAFANAEVPAALKANLVIEYKFEGQFGNMIEDTAGDYDATMLVGYPTHIPPFLCLMSYVWMMYPQAFPLWKTVQPRALDSISRTAVRFLDFNDQAQIPELSLPGGDMTFETVGDSHLGHFSTANIGC
jgi:hypothetical protein